MRHALCRDRGIQPARIIVDGDDNTAAVARLFGLRECRKKKKKNQPRCQKARTNQGNWSHTHSNSGASATPVIAASEQPRDDAGHLKGFDRLAHVQLKAAGKSAITIL